MPCLARIRIARSLMVASTPALWLRDTLSLVLLQRELHAEADMLRGVIP
jgi:hypothetical protein